MIKKSLVFFLSVVALICFSACSLGAPKIKCGVYRSETSDAYIEVFDDNTVQIVNCDLSVIERLLEDDTIYMAELNESDSEDLRERWDLNRDYVDNRVKYERDDEFYTFTDRGDPLPRRQCACIRRCWQRKNQGAHRAAYELYCPG